MAETSTNLGLTLPALSERLSLTVLNQNWELIDQFAGKVFIEFGSSSKSIDQNLTDYWTTYIPNDGKPHLVKINALYGICVGFLTRYSDTYGSGCLTRYDGTIYRSALNDGTVWNGALALNSQINTVTQYDYSQMGTAKNGTTVQTGASYTRAAKKAGWAFIKLRFTVPTISAATVVFTLVNALKPFADISYIRCFNEWNTGISEVATIGGNGDISVQPAASGKDLTLLVQYPCAN